MHDQYDQDEVGPTKAHLDDPIPEVQVVGCLIQQVTHLHRVAVGKGGTDWAYFGCHANQLGKAYFAICTGSC